MSKSWEEYEKRIALAKRCKELLKEKFCGVYETEHQIYWTKIYVGFKALGPARTECY